MKKLNLAVIYGGESSEHEVSKASAGTILANLSKEKYNVLPVFITQDGDWLYQGKKSFIGPGKNPCLLVIETDKITAVELDCAFPVLHGEKGEDGAIQGLFEMANLPYVGSGVLASAMAMNKAAANLTARANNIPQPDYFTFDKSDSKLALKQISYPCFVKPVNTGSSIGISKVKNDHEFMQALTLAGRFCSEIIVERAVAGREFECAVLGTAAAAKASVVGEIIPYGEFYDYDSKYNLASTTIAPADIPQNIAEEIRQKSLTMFKAMGCRGLARVDFFLEKGKVLFNEINTFPGFTSISMFPILWQKSGIKLPDLLDELIDIAIKADKSKA